MNALKKLRIAALAFAYGMLAASPALADDSEIYIGGVAGGTSGGAPNVLMLLDTSGSMLFRMYNTYPTGHPQAGQTVPKASSCSYSPNDCAANEDDKRIRHLINAVKRILENMDGNIRVGISRYNDKNGGEGDGGRIIYPVRRLDDPVSTSTTQDRTYRLGVSAADAHQSGSNGANIDLSSTTLLLGDTPPTSVNVSVGNDQVQAGTSSTVLTNDPSIIPLGAYFYYTNSGKTSYTNSASSVGLKYNVSIPKNATIVSAELVMTRSTSSITGPGSTACSRGCYPTGNSTGAFSVSLDFQTNTTTPADYADTAAARVNGTGRIYGGGVYSTTVNVGATELTASSTSKTVDVTSQVQALVNGGSWSTSASLALRLHGTDATLANPSPLTKAATTAVTNGRSITEPILRITWNEPDAMYTGVQFSGVDIPRGATINSAILQFTANQAASGTAQFEIKTDPAAIPAAFSSATNEHLDATRWNGGFSTTWNPGNWTNGSTYSADVRSILQQHVNQSSFCGGLGVAFRLRQTGTYSANNTNTRRYAYSYDSDATKAPRLVVNYTLPDEDDDTCLRASRTVSVRNGTDDGEDAQLTSLTARLRDATNIGLRFPNLNIPQGATIRTVTLKLKAANNASDATKRGNFTVRGVELADVATFGPGNTIPSLLASATTASQNFVPSAWVSGTAYEFQGNHTAAGKANDGLVGVVQTIVDQGTWNSGNALVLLLKGSRTGTDANKACGDNVYPCFYQADQGSASAASLVISYESNNSADGVKRVRQDLVETVETLTLNSYTPLNETYYESALYMLGRDAYYGRSTGSNQSSPTRYSYADAAPAMTTSTSNKYKSPIDGGTCQSNNIIMLTDGAPTGDERSVTTGTACTAASGGEDSWACMKNTATHLKTTGFTHGSPALQSYVSTYTIGFGPDVANENSAAYKGLAAVAAAGGGDSFFASDVDALVANFETIFARLTDTNGTMASPGVAVNQLNRTQHLDQLYYGVFKPQTTKRWPGNLKRYRLDANATGGPAVVDVEGRPAISAATKYFDANAKSWWGTETDGNEAAKGGAAARQLQTSLPLKVYTDTAGTIGLLNSAAPPTGMTADDVKWIQGYDVDNDNGQGATGPRQSMGAPMHAQPTMLAVNTWGYYQVFVGTNDGLLHSIDNLTGTHYWAWLPSDLQANVSPLRSNGALGNGGLPIYGLDGSWSLVDLADEASKRLLIGGMRQGGSNYYALKVDKNPAVAPQLAWTIRPTAGTAFENLGRTWSQPQHTIVRIGGVATPVMVFGGGLDFAKYEAGHAVQAGTGGDLGNAVYMVNAKTGALLWWASSAASTTSSSTNVPALKYSVPGGVRIIDKNGDGYADHLYFGDVGGQVFRVDMDNTSAAPKLVKRVNLLAQLGNAETTGKANDRRFYETPAVEYAIDTVGKLYAAVAIGSGDRTFPKSNRTTEERFYVIRDYDAARFDILANSDSANPSAGYMDADGRGYNGTNDLVTRTTPLKTTNLANLTTTFGATATSNAAAAKGWWLSMPSTGEKVLSAPFIFSQRLSDGTLEYQVNFNSFAPDSVAASGCSPVSGSTSAWSVLLANAASVSNPNSTNASDRYTEGVASGITGSGVPMVVDRDGDGQGDTLIELIGTGARDRGETPAGLGKIQRTRWYDRRTND